MERVHYWQFFCTQFYLDSQQQLVLARSPLQMHFTWNIFFTHSSVYFFFLETFSCRLSEYLVKWILKPMLSFIHKVLLRYSIPSVIKHAKIKNLKYVCSLCCFANNIQNCPRGTADTNRPTDVKYIIQQTCGLRKIINTMLIIYSILTL